MHTYLKNDDGTYSVGMWLPNREGVTAFVKMFDVANFYDACQSCTMLNGGGMYLHAITIIKEH